MADIRRSVQIDLRHFAALTKYSRISGESVESCIEQAVEDWLENVAVPRAQQIANIAQNEEVVSEIVRAPFVEQKSPRKTTLLSPQQAKLVLG